MKWGIRIAGISRTLLTSRCYNWRTPFSRGILKFAASTAMSLMLAISAHSQESRFLFDPSGDLAVQSSETGAIPQILTQPHGTPLIVGPGEMASFFVVLADNFGVSYQWRFNGNNIGGATSDTLVVTNASVASEGQYSVVVANGFGSVSSAPAMLWFDGNGNSMPDSWEMTYFGNLNNMAAGDFDGDGVSNLQEFLDGTNPTNAASRLFRLTVLSDGGTVQTIPDQFGYTNGQIVTLTATGTGSQSFRAWTGDITSQSNTISIGMTTNRSLFAHFGSIGLVWTNAAGGDWNTSSNWNPNLVPGALDTAMVFFGVTVTVTNPAECGSLLFGAVGTSPVLSCSNTLTLNGASFWVSGARSRIFSPARLKARC